MIYVIIPRHVSFNLDNGFDVIHKGNAIRLLGQSSLDGRLLMNGSRPVAYMYT